MSKQVLLDRDRLDELVYKIGLIEDGLSAFLVIIRTLKEHYEIEDSLSELYALSSCVDCQLTVACENLLKTLSEYDELFL